MAHGLNPSQHAAVHTLSGPLLVLAGAGTGKTRVVTFRIAELIRQGTSPERILAVTFTKKAAGEMQQRASELLNKGKKRRSKAGKNKPRPEISTFHSLCVRILRRHIKRLGYPETFTICDRSDQEMQARSALREIRVPGDSLKPGDLLGFIGRWKMKSISPEGAVAVAESDKEHLAAVAYRRYQNNLKACGSVDFDDLLLLTEQLFAKYPSVRREEAARFDQVLVDEYQDTNQSQYEIIRGLTMGHRNLCVVGDDDQSIYGWRGAEVTHILQFKKDWPEAKMVRLEINYRSTEAILDYANTLIVFNSQRHEKVLQAAASGGAKPRVRQFKDEEHEAQEVVADLKKLIDLGELQPRDVAILFRTNEQPRVFETALRKADVPYVLIGGMSFFDRREVRDILAYLKVIHNENDEPSLLRILNTPPRGIGDVARKALLAEAVASGRSIWDVMPAASHLKGVTSKASEAFFHLQKQFASWRKLFTDKPLNVAIEQLIADIRYREELRRLYPDVNDRESRVSALEEVVNAAAGYVRGSGRRRVKKDEEQDPLAGFLEEVAMGERDDTEDKDSQLERNAVALMTMHSAKGLEFPHVYMVGLEEGFLPHKRSIETGDEAIDEERRLCYVGVTRAKKRLTLSFALTRRKWGKSRDTIPSRFLFEMTGQAERAQTAQTRKDRPKRGKRPARPSAAGTKAKKPTKRRR